MGIPILGRGNLMNFVIPQWVSYIDVKTSLYWNKLQDVNPHFLRAEGCFTDLDMDKYHILDLITNPYRCFKLISISK